MTLDEKLKIIETNKRQAKEFITSCPYCGVRYYDRTSKVLSLKGQCVCNGSPTLAEKFAEEAMYMLDHLSDMTPAQRVMLDDVFVGIYEFEYKIRMRYINQGGDLKR